jgi:hypothetical protein
MNGSGQRPDVQACLWQLEAPQAILHTLTQVTHTISNQHNSHTFSFSTRPFHYRTVSPVWMLDLPSLCLCVVCVVMAQGGVLSCEGLCLGLRLLYHTCASSPLDMKGQGGFARLANSLEQQRGEGAWLTLLVPVRSTHTHTGPCSGKRKQGRPEITAGGVKGGQ